MPHDMKTILKILVVAITAVSLTSCLGGDLQCTPGIYCKYAFCTHVDGTRDTVLFQADASCVVKLGDTVKVPMYVDGVYHPLTVFQVSGDTSAVRYSFACDAASMRMLKPDSKLEEGYLHFADSCYGMSLSLYYIAKVKGDFPLTFSLSSLAAEPYAHNSLQVTQSVR